MIISEKKLQKYCNKYGFKYDDFFGMPKITTKHDIFYVKRHDDMIRLFHQNKNVRNNRKAICYHFQRDFNDYEHMFYYLVDHDKRFNKRIKKTQHFYELLNQVHNELVEAR